MMTTTNRILIVEDNQEIKESLQDILEVNGYETVTAENGLDALEKIRKNEVDLIISDIMMPVKDGFEMMRELRQDENLVHIPVIFLTAKAMMESKLQGLKYGANDYITKPFEMKELILKVKNLLNLKESLVQTTITNPQKIKVESRKEVFLRSVNDAIEKQIENVDFSMADLSSALEISTSSLQKKIKSIAGKSVSQYIREYRLKRAKDLILSQYGSLSEIATKTGFRSLSYFSKSFKNFYGYTPSESMISMMA